MIENIISLIIISLIIQYLAIFLAISINIDNDLIKSKKQLLYMLIPFYYVTVWYKTFVNNLKELKWVIRFQ